MLGPVCLLAARWIKIDSTTMSEKHEVDLFRQTAVRYLAFASESPTPSHATPRMLPDPTPRISPTFRRLWGSSPTIHSPTGVSGQVIPAFLPLLPPTSPQGPTLQCATPPTPTLLPCSYGIVAAYALADTLDRGAKSYFQQRKARPLMPALPARKRGAPVVASRTLNPRAVPALATMADSAMWHGAASLVLPGVLINR